MKPFSVVIPTANHPTFLRTALESVSAQTGTDSIEEVIVSENGGRRDSEKICAEFGNLPIRYIFHERPQSILVNFFSSFRAAQADLIAFLCDDDWWSPGHLQTALLSLREHDQAVASFSGCLHVESEQALHGQIASSAVLWLAAGKPAFTTRWVLKRKEILAALSLQTPFHLSTMVFQRRAVLKSAGHLEFGHFYTLDRDLYLALAGQGHVLYHPLVDTYIRWYDGNHTHSLDLKERGQIFHDQTDRIWDQAFKEGVDLIAIWSRHLARAPHEVREDIGRIARLAMRAERLEERGFGEFKLPSLPVRLWRTGTRLSQRAALSLKRRLRTH